MAGSGGWLYSLNKKVSLNMMLPMPYVTEENGKLNNYAREIEPVVMDPRTPSQKRLLVMTALMGAVLVAGSVWIATLVS